MLRELTVENLLLIERASLRLGPGLNVLTGETGAGKTVLAHALDLLLGGRPRAGIVRPGASEAYVEGIFDLPATPLEGERLGELLGADAEELVLARRLGADGRSRAYIGGRAANVADLRELGALLLSFYGQHEHRRLTLAAAQMQILDSECGAEQQRRLDACASAHARVRELETRLEELAVLAGHRERELGLLEFELGEIDELRPDAAEHERLLGARERMRSAGALTGAAGGACVALAGEDGEAAGASELLARAADSLGGVAGLDPSLDRLAERLRGALIESQELAGELRDYGAGSGFEDLDVPGVEPTLESVEARLEGLERVIRKHGGSVESVLEFAAQARARHEELAGAEVAIEKGEDELAGAREELSVHVAALRRARRKSAAGFAKQVTGQLPALAMQDASFEVVLGETEPGPRGGDTVEFVIAPNPGVPAGPLRDIASGGELSRVMLAIMSVASAAAPQATLVFDEVDAGIGGHTANAVGARLRELGERGQVICITHLPQIASLGARHFSIVKDTGAEPTRASVLELAEPEVVSELVRMLGADSGDAAARRHARDLRRAA
ncbi:MAG TPA: DNA repair protein RecN [Solirubrobacteraceae bacterium]|jgi:DNA repair protein RecN (Recombination protein N)|nr:DNA repair protein RecN [Solirubrobacteraceae bacterium]